MSDLRNIVLITLDSVRADHCSFMGYHRKTTPTLDRMARKGLVFENAIASGVATLPSMFGVITGDYPLLESNNYNARDWRKEFKHKKTIAQSLLEKGYSTAAFNRTAFFSFFGFSKGYSCFYELQSEETVNKWASSGKMGRIVYIIKNMLGMGNAFNPWTKDYNSLISICQKLKKPYFLTIVLGDTHHPYFVPRGYRKWSNEIYMLYSSYLAYIGKPRVKLPFLDPTKAYDDCIRFADEFVKRLWDDLKDDDPIFIIHGDHGEGFGEHGFYGHPPGYPVVLYEEFTHVPLIIYNADIKGKIDYPVSLRQIPATVMDLIGEENEFPTKSMLEEENDYVICKVFDRGKRKVAIRLKNWKFITGQKETDELYNLKKDPYEQENVIDEHPELVRELRKIVEMHVKHELKIRKIRESIPKIRDT